MYNCASTGTGPLALAEAVNFTDWLWPPATRTGSSAAASPSLSFSRVGFLDVSRSTRWSTPCTSWFCTVTGIVALRPERVRSDLSISFTSPVRLCRWVWTPCPYAAASCGRPRHEVDISRLIAFPMGVTTR